MKTPLLILLAAAAPLLADDLTDLPSPNSYAGVIRNASADDHLHAGWFGARLTSTGAFTARVSWQGFAYPLLGVLRPGGTFDATLHKVGGGTFSIHLDTVAVAGKIIVTVTDGAITSGTEARPALYGQGAPSPWTPKFNGVANHYPELGFLPNTDGRVRVSRGGSVRYLARLGDGSMAAAGSFLVEGDPMSFPGGASAVVGDKFPLYTGLYRPATRGSLWGDGEVIDYTMIPHLHTPFTQGAEGALQWYRPAQPSGPLPNTAGQAAVRPAFSEYFPPAPGEPVVPLAQPPLPPGQLTLLGGDLPATIVVPLDWNARQQFVPRPNSHEVRLYTEVREGIFLGSFRHPRTGRTVIFSGVYRPLAGAIGTFHGPDHVGFVDILGLD